MNAENNYLNLITLPINIIGGSVKLFISNEK